MKWWSVDMEIMYPSSRVSGTGSVSTLALSEEELREAEERRGPLGFTPDGLQYRPRQRRGREWGECDWTAPDLTLWRSR